MKSYLPWFNFFLPAIIHHSLRSNFFFLTEENQRIEITSIQTASQGIIIINDKYLMHS